jgi:hypothetical protein
LNLKLLGAAALSVAWVLCGPASGKEPTIDARPAPHCDVHLYPADALHSVGEDFDNVHELDQDVRHYYEMAGRPLNWLNTARQLELIQEIDVGAPLRIVEVEKTPHREPLTRRRALEAGPRTASPGCIVEILIPQVLLERGALSTRSLRVFGVVRMYQAGMQVRSYSGYAAAPMDQFQLRSPADADAATAIVETAYRQAVETMLRNSAKRPRK